VHYSGLTVEQQSRCYHPTSIGHLRSIRQLDEKEFQFVRNLDGVPCLWLPAQSRWTPEECLLFFHGNASRIEDLLDDMRIIQNRLPVTIVAVEYPGFGLRLRWPQQHIKSGICCMGL